MKSNSYLKYLVLAAFLFVAFMIVRGGGAGGAGGSGGLHARATIQGGPDGKITGVARFTQLSAEHHHPTPEVRIVVDVRGLTPGRHGMHIHEIGMCTAPDFLAAGGHFDPGPYGNVNPDMNHPFHMGDIPNLEANSQGVAHLEVTTNRISLSPGPLSVFDDNGSTIIIHQNPDEGIPGKAGSGVAGGPRVACGLIAPEP